jgi:hypothetical protein
MAFQYHDILGLGDIHIPHDLEFADQAARLAGSGLGSQHVGRLAKQLDDGSYWVLTQFTPSIQWAAFVPPKPVVGDIGSTLSVVSDGSGGVKLDWTGDASVTLDDAYNNSAGPASVTVDAGDVLWNLTGPYTFGVDLSAITGTVDGFVVSNGLDTFSLIRQASDNIDLGAGLRQLSIICSDISDIRAGNTHDFTLGARGGTITLNQSGDTALSGFTATSIIGALNEVKTNVEDVTLDQAYDNDGGAASIAVNNGDVTWNISGSYSFNLDLSGLATSSTDGFIVVNGADDFKITRSATDKIDLNATLEVLDLDVATSLNLKGTPKIITNAAQNLNLVPGAGGITQIGDAGSTSHSLNTNDDLFVSGKLEVDGLAYFDGGIESYASMYLGPNFLLYTATATGAFQPANTNQTNNAPCILTGTNNNYLLFCEYADRTFNFAHSVQTNPTIFLHSANQSTTEWISFSHNQTDGVIQTGEGNIQLLPATGGITQIGDAGSTSRGLTSNDDLYISGKLEIDSTVYVDSKVIFASNANCSFGTNEDSKIRYNTVQTNTSLMLGVDTTSLSVIITDVSDFSFDFAHDNQTNPTLFIHSPNQSTTEWISFSHNQTDGVIQTGKGKIQLLPVAGSVTQIGDAGSPGTVNTNDDLFVSGNLEIGGSIIGGNGTPNVGFYAYRTTSNQTLNNLTETKVQFNTDENDDGSDYDATTNYQFTAPSTGRYTFNAGLYVTLAAAGYCEIRLYVNSTLMRTGVSRTTAASNVFPTVGGTFKLSTNDTVEIRAFQNSGFASTIQTSRNTSFDGGQISEV